MPADVPGYPGRRLPMQSEDQGDDFERAVRAARQAEQVANAVEEKLGKRLSSLESAFLSLDLRLKEFEEMTAKAKAFAASTTVKVLMGMIGSGGIAGFIARVTAPAPQATQTVLMRGVLERTIETACNPLPSVDERIKCAARVAAEQAAGSQK